MALGRASLLCAVGVSAFALGLGAQQPSRPAATPSAVDSGKKLFVQRCSVCHLPPLGPGSPTSHARPVNGYVKSPQAEATARAIILKGIPQRMPGFQYSLQPAEVDHIVAYLSSLK